MGRDGEVGALKKEGNDSDDDAILVPGIPENATRSCGVDVFGASVLSGRKFGGGGNPEIKENWAANGSSERVGYFRHKECEIMRISNF